MQSTTLSARAQAARHPMVHRGPAVDFFSGALLGNGGFGAVVCTRPDAVVIRFGHNDVWDIRVSEHDIDRIGTFREIFGRVQAIPEDLPRIERDPWFKAYCEEMSASYSRPWPRPFPCGTLLVGFDRRRVELMGHRLDIASGLCAVELRVAGRPATLEVFVDFGADRLWAVFHDERGKTVESPFDRVRVMPDPDGLAGDGTHKVPGPEIPDPLPDRCLAFRQVLPRRAPPGDPGRDPADRAFRLSAFFSFAMESRSRPCWYGGREEMAPLERAISSGGAFVVCIQLEHGLAANVSPLPDVAPEASPRAAEKAAEASRAGWTEYWERSAVALDDEELERTWYWNQYLLRCAVRSGATCPGLWANWSYRNIGTAWHGDYHMNYNAQQPFWGTFSSNHVDLHLPYVDLVERLLPVSRRWAREYYGLRGAAFPHSAYPVEMNVNPYPVPTWGWEICETPWTVQSLWWHYRATMDREFLEQRAFVPIREAVLFLVDYLRRPEAAGERWGDDRYHIFPTVAPELYGVAPGLRFNRDCLVDITLTRFVLAAFLQACGILGYEEAESALVAEARDVLAHLPELPTAEGPEGRVYVSVPGEDPEMTYNVPVPGMPVFPGEERGLGSPRGEYELAARSWRRQKLEGGNELVFSALQGARLGILDLEKFKRQVRFCLMENGACTDLALQANGRYDDDTPFDFMARMGVWIENAALPAVVNECLMQSHDRVLRLFPNWPLERDAAFRTLRAMGAFLVSAELRGGVVRRIEVASEAGSPLRVLLPWGGGAVLERGGRRERVPSPVLEIPTAVGETIVLRPA